MNVRTRKRAEEYTGLSHLTTTVAQTPEVGEYYKALKAQLTKQLEDEFAGIYGGAASGFAVLEPMYPPITLNKHAMSSGVLRTCIEAMATNVDGFGYTLEYVGPEGGQDTSEAVEEYTRASGLLDHPNGEYSLIDLRKRFRIDKESAGYGTIEIVRNPDDGFPDVLHHAPSYTVRVTTQDTEVTVAARYMPRPGARDNMMQVKTRFRRLVQMVGSKRAYFREVGDTRAISATTGRAMAAEGQDDAASDMLIDMHYAPGSRYGAPRWIGDLRSVLGIQESETLNLGYFKDNGIPAMMLLILGGALSTQGQADFKSVIQQARGTGMQNKIVMLEVKGDDMAASDKGTIQRPDIRLEPLMQVRPQDAFFQEYESNSAKKIRSSFRLPAIFTGLTEEVRMAVAQASLTLAESQVFGPERAQTDDLFNYHILTYNGRPMRFWRYKSNPPRIHDESAIMAALKTFEQLGAMTPNIAIELANTMFDMRIAMVEDGWGDMPFEFSRGQRVDPVTGDFVATSPAAPPEPPIAPSPGDGDAVKATRKRTRKVPTATVSRSTQRAATVSTHRDVKWCAGGASHEQATARSTHSTRRADAMGGNYVWEAPVTEVTP
jgi:PBSX family phage portal protein